MTVSESRSLLRSVISKYQYELKDALNNTLIDTIIKARNATNCYDIDIRNDIIASELNRIIGLVDGNLPPVTRKKGAITVREIKPSAYEKLITLSELSKGIYKLYLDTLATAVRENNVAGNYILTTTNVLAEQMNIVLQKHDTTKTLAMIKEVKGEPNKFIVIPVTYEKLTEFLKA